jgi:1,2-dihydroxy-3-keto-5-methylthiopentene dioxygenase
VKVYWLETGVALSPADLVGEGIFAETVTEPIESVIAALMDRAGYVTRDEVLLTGDNIKYDEICAKFDKEHYHTDDEVRLVVEGEGIFDIRALTDEWVRVEVGVGDLIIVPAGRHHRFLMTSMRHIKAVRLFKDASGWTPHYRL